MISSVMLCSPRMVTLYFCQNNLKMKCWNQVKVVKLLPWHPSRTKMETFVLLLPPVVCTPRNCTKGINRPLRWVPLLRTYRKLPQFRSRMHRKPAITCNTQHQRKSVLLPKKVRIVRCRNNKKLSVGMCTCGRLWLWPQSWNYIFIHNIF